MFYLEMFKEDLFGNIHSTKIFISYYKDEKEKVVKILNLMNEKNKKMQNYQNYLSDNIEECLVQNILIKILDCGKYKIQEEEKYWKYLKNKILNYFKFEKNKNEINFPTKIGGRKKYLQILKKLEKYSKKEKWYFQKPDNIQNPEDRLKEMSQKLNKEKLQEEKMLRKLWVYGASWRLFMESEYTEYFKVYMGKKFDLTYLYILREIIESLNIYLKEQGFKSFLECENIKKIEEYEKLLNEENVDIEDLYLLSIGVETSF